MARIESDTVTPQPEPTGKPRFDPEIPPPDHAAVEAAGGDAVLVGLEPDPVGRNGRSHESCAILDVSVGLATYLCRLIERDLARQRGRRHAAERERARSLVMFLRDRVAEVREEDGERLRRPRHIRRLR
jgi:hypothetical protein